MQDIATRVKKIIVDKLGVDEAEVTPEEIKLVKTLMAASTAKRFDFSKYKDVYTEKLTKLIEAKVAGQEIVAPPAEEHAHVINLMDALKQSLAKAQGADAETEAEKPPKKKEPSTRDRKVETRKKKSS